MSSQRMLIDATHPEETRVVVLSGNRLEDFDVEVESRKQLKGNIYLAKVIRVEPSLQAAFVDYGGNRHGFLAFNEIHPDYFQIPISDLEALEAEQDAAESVDEDSAPEDSAEAGGVETVGGDDSEDVEIRRPRPVHRRYKIQEVVKRRQILLVQVVKEERGNKGAALTTFVSLAGRYCVLMPNTARGGGISRKISSGADRKKLKTILSGLDIPEGMAVIVRTAGSKRSKSEIKRDYEYLLRLWDSVRELTLDSSAPTLVHEEGNLIKRSIRDIYNSEIGEIIVAGEGGYRTAKDFMKLLIPSHAKRVQPYHDDSVPLIRSYKVEEQLDAMHSPTVQLKSGGYVVINPTEALVAIDVNSGRATRERNIEETALKTNLEAAEEVARQVRLRDLAGLIVIDFIDMEVSRNNARVERRLKEAMRNDRARIQLGRISPFGLLEMSRQRLRPSLIETSSEPCQYCAGTGVRRSTESSALFLLRAIEEESNRRRSGGIVVHVPTEIALYILNHKREALANIESRSRISVLLTGDDSLIPPNHRFEKLKERDLRTPPAKEAKAEEEEEEATEEQPPEEEEGGKRRRRSRRRRRRPAEKDRAIAADAADAPEAGQATAAAPAEAAETGGKDRDEATTSGEETPSKRRRRGRRGGRRRSRKPAEQPVESDAMTPAEVGEAILLEGPTLSPLLEGPPEVALVTPPPEASEPPIEVPPAAADPKAGKAPPRRRRAKSPAAGARTRKSPAKATAAAEPEPAAAAAEPEAAQEAAKPKPKPRRRRKPAAAKDDAKTRIQVAEAPPATAPEPTPEPTPEAIPSETPGKGVVVNIGSKEAPVPESPPRKGWWRR